MRAHTGSSFPKPRAARFAKVAGNSATSFSRARAVRHRLEKRVELGFQVETVGVAVSDHAVQEPLGRGELRQA